MQVDGIKNLIQQLASGEYKEWDLVLNIAEGLHGLAREAHVPCLLETYGIPITTALCLDKGRTKVNMHLWRMCSPGNANCSMSRWSWSILVFLLHLSPSFPDIPG